MSGMSFPSLTQSAVRFKVPPIPFGDPYHWRHKQMPDNSLETHCVWFSVKKVEITPLFVLSCVPITEHMSGGHLWTCSLVISSMVLRWGPYGWLVILPGF